MMNGYRPHAIWENVVSDVGDYGANEGKDCSGRIVVSKTWATRKATVSPGEKIKLVCMAMHRVTKRWSCIFSVDCRPDPDNVAAQSY